MAKRLYKPNHPHYQEMMGMRTKGKTYQEIADTFSLSRERICQIIGRGRLRTITKLTGKFYKIRHVKEQLFWEDVDIKGRDDCWEWLMNKFPSGYGRKTWNGKTNYAHIVAYTLVKGSVPDGLEVCHTCNDRSCCNPNHLYAGTHQQNIDDREARYAAGEIMRWRSHENYCKHGHLLSETRKTTENGRSYCGECGRLRARAKRESLRQAAHP